MFERLGYLTQVMGSHMIANGPPNTFIGEICDVYDKHQYLGQAEVIGFKDSQVTLLPYQTLQLKAGLTLKAQQQTLTIPISAALLGRVINVFGEPIDGKGTLFCEQTTPLTLSPINPLDRKPIQSHLLTHINAIDSFIPIGLGQRMGIFAKAGLGKTTLLSQLATQLDTSINVIALVGERGREVKMIIEALGEKLKNSIVVVATSDTSPIERRLCALSAHAIAQYFSKNNHVLLLVDSITRLAMAERDIAMMLGEPPTIKGFTPSLFSLLPKLTEIGGNFNCGSITAIYTILAEGDERYDPIVEVMKSLLDGHIFLSSQLAERGQYPAIDILKSQSRLSQILLSKEHSHWVSEIRNALSYYAQYESLIQLGVYQNGQDIKLDKAITVKSKLQKLLNLKLETIENTIVKLKDVCS